MSCLPLQCRIACVLGRGCWSMAARRATGGRPCCRHTLLCCRHKQHPGCPATFPFIPQLLSPHTSPARPLCCRNEHAYVYSRLPNLIQGQGQLAAKFTFQPASLQASTHTAAVKLHCTQTFVHAPACLQATLRFC